MDNVFERDDMTMLVSTINNYAITKSAFSVSILYAIHLRQGVFHEQTHVHLKRLR